jgi:3-deoxy-7-phosphoheptulonate synthase
MTPLALSAPAFAGPVSLRAATAPSLPRAWAFCPASPPASAPARRVAVVAVAGVQKPRPAAEAAAGSGSWSVDSWRAKPALQQPQYPDSKALAAVEAYLGKVPPLVAGHEMRELKGLLKGVCEGRGFVLQGGDCAESLDETEEGVTDTVRTLFKMAMILMWGSYEPVVKIGRVGGQYAKPRSADMERRGDVELPSYRGEIINASDFTPEARIPDPERMIRGYNHSASTTNLVRSLASGGFGDLTRVREWGMDWASATDKGLAYADTARAIEDSLRFMSACGVDHSNPALSSTKVFTSHEGLLLPYEQALTRMDPDTGEYYACSGNLIWLGERTRQLDGAHVEFARGIANPIAVKAGPTMRPDELLRLIDVLNPTNEPGRLTVITRMGADKIRGGLPPLLRTIKREGRNVVWVTDSMHGNTYTSESGYKTRAWEQIWNEVSGFFEAHEAEGTRAGGVHFEMTGREVTECVGGIKDIRSEDLSERYESLCDPRLNQTQSLELAFNIADYLRKHSTAQ